MNEGYRGGGYAGGEVGSGWGIIRALLVLRSVLCFVPFCFFNNFTASTGLNLLFIFSSPNSTGLNSFTINLLHFKTRHRQDAIHNSPRPLSLPGPPISQSPIYTSTTQLRRPQPPRHRHLLPPHRRRPSANPHMPRTPAQPAKLLSTRRRPTARPIRDRRHGRQARHLLERQPSRL